MPWSKKSKRNMPLFPLVIGLILILSALLIISSKCEKLPHSEYDSVPASSLQEYRFSELGLSVETLEWNGKGDFQITMNKTFDLHNIGPIMILLEFTAKGDKPDSPGYIIGGTYNQKNFTTIITRSQLLISGNEVVIQQIAIPLEAKAKIFFNNLVLNVSCKSDTSNLLDGSLAILESSKLLVGDILLLDSYGNFPTRIYPNKLFGQTSLSGVLLKSYIQLTIENETLIKKAKYQIILSLEIDGDISLSLLLRDNRGSTDAFQKNKTSSTEITATTAFSPSLGVNFFGVEVTIYGNAIWSTTFTITFSNCYVLLKESSKPFGFSDLEIPFFQWPSIPIVGVLILFLWIMPYSILKYREWKKLPNEIDINILDDNDNEMNILDPEGLTMDGTPEEIDETFESLED